MILMFSILILTVACEPQMADLGGEPLKKPPYKIGAIFPLTGPVAVAGEFVRTGLLLAVDEVNKQGGINGIPLELVIEDDACDPKKAVTSFQKLAEVDNVPAIIGPFCSGSALATAPLANEKKVIEITSGAATPLLTSAGDYVFRVSPSDNFQATFMAEQIGTRHQRLAILYLQNQQATDMEEAFLKSFVGKITAIESFSEGDIDIKSQLEKIAKSEPEALLVLVFPAQYSFVTKQIVELGIDLPLYASHTFETPESLKLGAQAERYKYSIQSYNTSLLPNHEFIAAYKDRFNKTPSIWSMYTYDAVLVLAEALKQCPQDSFCIKDRLYALKGYNGVSGFASFDQNGDSKEYSYHLKTVKNNTFVPLIDSDVPSRIN